MFEFDKDKFDIKGPFPVVRKLDGNVVPLPNSPLLRKKAYLSFYLRAGVLFNVLCNFFPGEKLRFL
jgi:hypothetical protein